MSLAKICCYGYDKFKERAMEYPPDKVSEITWVEKDKIIEAARMYATSKPAAISWGVATDQIGRNQTYVAHTKNCLRGITGNGSTLARSTKKDRRLPLGDTKEL